MRTLQQAITPPLVLSEYSSDVASFGTRRQSRDASTRQTVRLITHWTSDLPRHRVFSHGNANAAQTRHTEGVFTWQLFNWIIR